RSKRDWSSDVCSSRTHRCSKDDATAISFWLPQILNYQRSTKRLLLAYSAAQFLRTTKDQPGLRNLPPALQPATIFCQPKLQQKNFKLLLLLSHPVEGSPRIISNMLSIVQEQD